jgi:Tfp pilus assembly protein PilZ
MSKGGLDHRVDPRLALSLPVRVSSIDAETDTSTRRPFFRATRAWCVNVSRGGAFLRTSEPFEPGRRVMVQIHLPDGHLFDSVGRVAWIRRAIPEVRWGERAEAHGLGIEFLAAAPADVAALERTLRAAGKGHEHDRRYVV